MGRTDSGDLASSQPQDVAVEWRAGGITVFGAWWLLVLVDVLIKALGFRPFFEVFKRWPTTGAVPALERAAAVRATCAAVSRAIGLYVRPVRCLQGAAAATAMLRLRGVRADLVIGVSKLPFDAHAWVDVDGEVVFNARPELGLRFREIVRC